MDDGTLWSIGEVARRAGLTVKAVRFYSDRGLVAPVCRSGAGYRRYGPDAVARLALVRTLRELGLGLDVIRRVVERELSLGEVATRHAAALEAQIGVLRLRRAVLTAVAERGPSPEEMARMHRLARLGEDERRRLTGEFLDAVFAGTGGGAHAGARRSLTPELPGTPTEEQLAAWVELAELLEDPEFRAGVRRAVEEHTDDARPGRPPRPDVVALARDHANAALASGIDPCSPEAERVVAALGEDCARLLGRPDDSGLRPWMLRRLSAANDPRRERYAQLLAVVNGWPAPEPLAPALDWSVAALSERTAG